MASIDFYVFLWIPPRAASWPGQSKRSSQKIKSIRKQLKIILNRDRPSLTWTTCPIRALPPPAEGNTSG